ncbi:MAG: SDR family oxidoreductase [Acidimicrobiia bacterium]
MCPGGVRTPIAATPPRSRWAAECLASSFARGATMVEPDEIAGLISWLGSDEATNLNGAVISSDGGMTSA